MSKTNPYGPTDAIMSLANRTEVSEAEYDVVLFIARVQPFHYGHMNNVAQALALGKKAVVIIGSEGQAPDTRNPFTYEERAFMVKEAFNNNPRLITKPLRDHPYNDNVWASYVQKIVEEVVPRGATVALIGHKKADTEYYLNMFPQWDFIETADVDDSLNATRLRKTLFETSFMVEPELWWKSNIDPFVPPTTSKFLMEWAWGVDEHKYLGGDCTLRLDYMREEMSFLKMHAKKWANAPYTPMFITVDAVVIQSGHVLVIKRRSAPGKGLLAMPGGYLEAGERIIDGCIRELYEETRLKVSKPILRGSIVGEGVYDYPARSLRGRIVTHTKCIQLQPGPLPKVKGEDDAAKAFWLPITEFYTMRNQFFEDHWYVIDDMIQRFVK